MALQRKQPLKTKEGEPKLEIKKYTQKKAQFKKRGDLDFESEAPKPDQIRIKKARQATCFHLKDVTFMCVKEDSQ